MQKSHVLITRLGLVLVAVIAFSAMGCESEASSEASSDNGFARPVIDVGVVVSDLDRSLHFYEEVVGMTRTGAFDLDEDFGQRSGLTDGRPVHVEVLQLEEGDDATAWKLMTFGDEASPQENDFIHDHTGVQYITINVTSLDPVLERIRENDMELLGETPTPLNDDDHFILIQDPDGTFVELIGPLEDE